MGQRGMTGAAVLALLTAGALPALVSAHHSPGHQGGGQGQNSVTIEATSPVTFGRSTVVSGRLQGPDKAGTSVDLQADEFPYSDSDFTQVASVNSAQNGDYRFTNAPQRNTRYRVVAKASPPVTSSAVTVLVRLQVKLSVSDSTPRAGRTVRFSGTVCPEHDGATAFIQRRTSSGAFRRVATTTLQDVPGGTCSSFARRVRIRRDGVYRVRVRSGDADHASGISRRIRIDAR